MVLITIVTGANLNQLTSLGASHCIDISRPKKKRVQARVEDMMTRRNLIDCNCLGALTSRRVLVPTG